MTPQLTWAPFAFAAIGAALGLVYFALLDRAVRAHVAGAPVRRIAGLHVLRGAAALGVFWLLAQHGATALVAALAGFVAARVVVQRRACGGP